MLPIHDYKLGAGGIDFQAIEIMRDEPAVYDRLSKLKYFFADVAGSSGPLLMITSSGSHRFASDWGVCVRGPVGARLARQHYNDDRGKQLDEISSSIVEQVWH
jgi:hypothetical protein